MSQKTSTANGNVIPMSLTEEQQRVLEVLASLFGGSESEMAERVGLSQSTISRIVHGRRNPGPKVLRAIAALPGVTSEWALRGRGEPPQVEALRDPGHCLLPLFTSLGFAFRKSTGPPHPGPWFSVSPEHYSKTRVLFRVPPDGDCVRRSAGRLKSTDVVIFETNRQLWNANPKYVDEKVCVIATPGREDQNSAELVRVSLKCARNRQSKSSLQIRRFQILDATPKPPSEKELATAITRTRLGRPLRSIVFSQDRNIRAVPPQPRARRDSETVELENILAVAITVTGRP